MQFGNQELQVIKAMTAHPAPNSFIATVLGVDALQVTYARNQHGWTVGKGRTSVQKFIWTARTSDFHMLNGQQRMRFKIARERALTKIAAAACRVELGAGDLNPVEAIPLYRNVLPALVLRKLFGLSEKFFARLSRTLKAVPNQSTMIRLITLLHREETEELDLSSFSLHQQECIARILADARREFRRLRQRKTGESVEALWEQMIQARKRVKVKGVACRGRSCKERARDPELTWPWTTQFFFRAMGNPGNLSYCCKYCDRLSRVARASRPVTPHETPNLSASDTKRLVQVLQRLKGSVPTAYLRLLFGLTNKQYCRLRSLAALKSRLGKGQGRLYQWRYLTERDFPRLPMLTETEVAALRKIWKQDVKAWQRELQAEDQVLLRTMELEQQRVETGEPLTKKKGKRKCTGGCKKRWYRTKYLFPPTYARYRGFCRYCLNRATRKPGG